MLLKENVKNLFNRRCAFCRLLYLLEVCKNIREKRVFVRLLLLYFFFLICRCCIKFIFAKQCRRSQFAFQTLTPRLEVIINTTTKTKLVSSVSFGNVQSLFRPFVFKMSIDRVAPSLVTRRVYYCPYLKRLTFVT